MYSRYTGYQPFVPMNNRLSVQMEEQAEEPFVPDEAPAAPPAPEPPAAFPAAAAAAVSSLPQKNLLESLFGGGGHSRSRRGGHNSGLGNIANLGNLGSLGGITDLLRSGGGGITKILKNFSIDWDAGDILLVLILLFMSLESDDDEILILLGLILVLGL